MPIYRCDMLTTKAMQAPKGKFGNLRSQGIYTN